MVALSAGVGVCFKLRHDDGGHPPPGRRLSSETHSPQPLTYLASQNLSIAPNSNTQCQFQLYIQKCIRQILRPGGGEHHLAEYADYQDVQSRARKEDRCVEVGGRVD